MPSEWTEALDPQNAEPALRKVRAHMFQLCRLPVVEKAALLPNASLPTSAPSSMPVGAAIASRAIHPGFHGSDIACSVHATFFPSAAHPAKILDEMMRVTCFGQESRPRNDRFRHDVIDEPVWSNPFLKGLDKIGHSQLGHQGYGSHFASVGAVSITRAATDALETNAYSNLAAFIARNNGQLQALVTHHGSRGLGAAVFKRGRDRAFKLTREALGEAEPEWAWIPPDTEDGQAYMHALQFVSRWTHTSHRLIHEAVMRRLGVKKFKSVSNEHNFVWERDGLFFHARGATPAWQSSGHQQLCIIPLNMAQPILLALGRDNAEFLSFVPQGAGRDAAPSAILRPFRDDEGEIIPHLVKEEIDKTTAGLAVRWYNNRPDLTQAPIAFRNPQSIIDSIQNYELADIIAQIQPQACIMAGEPELRGR